MSNGEPVKAKVQECMVCHAVIREKHYLCKRHYNRLPEPFRPIPGRRLNRESTRIVKEYWQTEVDEGREPAEGMKVGKGKTNA